MHDVQHTQKSTHVDSAWIHFCYFCVRKIFGPIIRLIWVKEVSGISHIPSKGPVIVAFNHQSYFDFICFIAISPRNIHYLSAEKFFTHPVWRILMKITGQIPVQRKAHDKRDLHTKVLAHLEAGKMVGIFPEGTRNPDPEKMSWAFSGVAKYAIQAKVPVVPVGIIDAHKVMAKGDKKPKFEKIIGFKIGEPIHFTKYLAAKMNKKGYRVLTDKVMIEISKLSQKIYPHVGKFERA